MIFCWNGCTYAAGELQIQEGLLTQAAAVVCSGPGVGGGGGSSPPLPVGSISLPLLGITTQSRLEVAVSRRGQRRRTWGEKWKKGDFKKVFLGGLAGEEVLPAVSSQSPRLTLMSSRATEPQSQKLLQVLTKATWTAEWERQVWSTRTSSLSQQGRCKNSTLRK